MAGDTDVLAGDADVAPGVDVSAPDGDPGETVSDVDVLEPADVAIDIKPGDDVADSDAEVGDEEPLHGSCAEIRRADAQATSGSFMIDRGTGAPIEVHCEMEVDGGVGHTMKRLDDAGLARDQNVYRAACEAIGMEVIVPRTRAHAQAILAFNDGVVPNLINVFPKAAGARGLHNWQGRCRGEACSFFVSEATNSNCPGDHFEPSGDNDLAYSLYMWATPDDANYLGCGFGRWNDERNTVMHTGYVICSTNDVTLPVRASCNDYRRRDEVRNVGVEGTSGVYSIDHGSGAYPVYCDMSYDRGGWTHVWKNAGNLASDVLQKSNETLWAEGASWAPGQPSPLVEPVYLNADSALHRRAWAYFIEQPHQTWLKHALLYPTGALIPRHQQRFHVNFNANTYADVVNSTQNCRELPEYIEVTMNAQDFVGRTKHLAFTPIGSRISYGLASVNRDEQACASSDNVELISDTNNKIAYLASPTTLAMGNTLPISYLFSYSHGATASKSRSRCLYACWGSSGFDDSGFYDAFSWSVRGPLVYDSCAEVRRIDPLAPSGQYTIAVAGQQSKQLCTF
ncbi:MAG: hypothetical protein H0U74_18600 [Bradymonadaceae bacterium]|nr:hypothetical protein [Lujinxingiaceae bacterium]